MSYDVPESVFAATEDAVRSAGHLTKMDAGAIAALLKLAKQIDYLYEHHGISVDGKFDNVSVPTYLRYCESLGLTPAGRAKNQGTKAPVAPSGRRGGLAGLQGGVSK